MTTAITERHSYLLGHSDEEIRRLILQSSFVNDLTRRMLLDAGIESGMRVLDIGSGCGDVALLAADLVGPTGEVVGVDASDKALGVARARAGEFGFGNIRFIEGDLHAQEFDEPFDAVVGRLVLMHTADPVAALSAVLQHVRPGCIVAFQEFNIGPDTICSDPPHSYTDKLNYWFSEAGRRAGIIVDMGWRLSPTFIAAGLPLPTLRLESPMGCGPEWRGWEWGAETVRAFLPAIVGTGVASEEEIDIDTLAERLRAEGVAKGCVIRTVDVVSAWSRKP